MGSGCLSVTARDQGESNMDTRDSERGLILQHAFFNMLVCISIQYSCRQALLVFCSMLCKKG